MVKSVIWSAVAALLFATSPAWAALKIGYVNYAQLMQQSPQAQSVLRKLRSEFLPREQALVKLQKQLKARANKFQRDEATMTDDQREETQSDLAERDRDLQRRQQDLQDELNSKRNEALSSLQRTLLQTVRAYAKAQNFDLILAQGVVYAKNSIDVTPQILSRLKASAKSGGARR